MVQTTFSYAWQENASLALSDDDVEKYYSDMFNRIFNLLAGIMAFLIGMTPLLFKLLIKGDYGEAYPQIPILFIGAFFSTISAFLGGIYVAHKRTKNVGITTMAAAVFNLLIDLALVQPIGIYAASISTLVSYMFLAIYRMWDIQRFQKITYHIPKIIFIVLILAVMCGLCRIDNTMTMNAAILTVGCVFAAIINRRLIRKIWEMVMNKFSRKA